MNHACATRAISATSENASDDYSLILQGYITKIRELCMWFIHFSLDACLIQVQVQIKQTNRFNEI